MISELWRAARQPYFDVEFNISTQYVARIIERPGRWMEDAALSVLAAELRGVAKQVLPGDQLDYGVFSTDRACWSHSVITLVRHRDDRRPVAFNALACMEVDLGHRTEDVLHLGLVMVAPGVRSQGMSWVLYGLTCVLMLFRNGLHPLWVSNVTQVPAVMGLVGSGFAKVFPVAQPGPANRRSLMHLQLARTILRQHRAVFGVGADAQFDEERFVIENAYTGGSDALKKTFAEVPKHRDAAVNAFCEDQLDYDRGDDVLQLGQMDMATALSYIRREVPPRSIAALAIAVLAVVVQRAALPIWQWGNTTRDFGSLRARL